MTPDTESRRTEQGASSVEYGLLAAGIAALIVAVVVLFGGAVQGLFTDTCSTVGSEMSAHGGTADCD